MMITQLLIIRKKVRRRVCSLVEPKSAGRDLKRAREHAFDYFPQTFEAQNLDGRRMARTFSGSDETSARAQGISLRPALGKFAD
jgi:hypothetical protein